MNPVPIIGCTRILNKPADWDEKRDGQYGHLAVRDELLPGTQVPAMVSVWQPTAAELAELKVGGVLLLYICGQVHPPCSVQVGSASQSQVN